MAVLRLHAPVSLQKESTDESLAAMTSYEQRCAEAVQACKLPADFAAWPIEHRRELLQLAHRSAESSEQEARRLVRLKPRAGAGVLRAAERQRRFANEVTGAM